MKNLKDEIEGIMNEHSYKQDVRDFGKPATVTQYKAIDLVEALTSLIEQEREKAEKAEKVLRGFIDYLDQSAHLTKNGIMVTGGGDYEVDFVDFNYEVEQYLKERKE